MLKSITFLSVDDVSILIDPLLLIWCNEFWYGFFNNTIPQNYKYHISCPSSINKDVFIKYITHIGTCKRKRKHNIFKILNIDNDNLLEIEELLRIYGDDYHLHQLLHKYPQLIIDSDFKIENADKHLRIYDMYINNEREEWFTMYISCYGDTRKHWKQVLPAPLNGLSSYKDRAKDILAISCILMPEYFPFLYEERLKDKLSDSLVDSNNLSELSRIAEQILGKKSPFHYYISNFYGKNYHINLMMNNKIVYPCDMPYLHQTKLKIHDYMFKLYLIYKNIKLTGVIDKDNFLNKGLCINGEIPKYPCNLDFILLGGGPKHIEFLSKDDKIYQIDIKGYFSSGSSISFSGILTYLSSEKLNWKPYCLHTKHHRTIGKCKFSIYNVNNNEGQRISEIGIKVRLEKKNEEMEGYLIYVK